MIKKTLFFFITFLISLNLNAQTPFIRNFPPKEYKAYSQNWSIIQDQRGIMYFGNNNGILEYDGINWKTITTPSTVYSLNMDNSDCIYVGLNGDFGYLEADSIGNLQYKSLKEKIPKEYRDFNNVWETIVTGNKIVFRTTKILFILKDNCISVILSDSEFRNPFVIDNRFYIAETGKGLLFLDNDSLCSSQDAEKFNYEDVVSMISYEKEDILITTFERGVFIYNPNKSPSLWKPEGFEAVDKLLFENEPYCGTLLPNGSFAIGTSVGGVIVFDKKGKIQNHFNKQNGLQSNDVHYLFVDSNNQLWIALDKGISLIMNNLPFTSGTDKNGIEGTIYSIHKFKNKLYVGTNLSLYVQNTGTNFDCIEGTKGQNYFLYPAKGKLLLGNHPKGIFDISDNKALSLKSLKDLGSVTGISLRKHPNYFITQVWDRGLALLELKNEQWSFKQYIKSFDKNALSIKEDMTGDLWISTGFQLYKIRLNETLDSVIFLKYYSPEQYHIPKTSLSPYQLNNGEIIFGSDKGVYRYLSDEDSFEQHPYFPMFTEGIYNLKQDASGNIWFNETRKGNVDEKGVLQLINEKYKIKKTPFLKFLDKGTTFIYPYSDSLVYFGTANGLLEYHPKQIVNYNIPFNTLIREIFVNDSLFYGGTAKNSSSISDNPIIFKYKDNKLFFYYAATFYEDSEKNLFSYRLIGSSDTIWSAWTNDHKKEYTNLHEGKYIFEVKSQNIYRKHGLTASFAFEILPPWHRTWWAYTLYVLLTIVFILILIRINLARLKHQNELLKKTVNERTADIYNQKEELQVQSEKLTENNERLNLLNSTKDKFFAIISHDLRSPFSSILGFADLLVENYDEFDDSQKKEILLSLRKSSRSAFELLENLLSWSQIQRGQIKINKEKLNLKELVEISIMPYKYNASQKNISIIINIPSDTQFFLDSNTSRIFIANLVNNAIKFTPEGGNITISFHENDTNIELHIIDTGVGMTSDIIEKLFKIDENISTKGTNNEKGTGLGLILCKEFIQKNDGDISVSSEVGKGSDFIITFSK